MKIVEMERAEECLLAMAQAEICNAMKETHLTRARLARKLGISRARMTQLLCGDANFTVKTLARVLSACGFELRLLRVLAP